LKDRLDRIAAAMRAKENQRPVEPAERDSCRYVKGSATSSLSGLCANEALCLPRDAARMSYSNRN
jgi:hypothetical protein